MERLKSIGHSIFKPRLELRKLPPLELSPRPPQLRTPTPRPDLALPENDNNTLYLKSHSANSIRRSLNRNTLDNQPIREVKSVPAPKPKANRRIGITLLPAKKKSATFNRAENHELNTRPSNVVKGGVRGRYIDAEPKMPNITTEAGFIHPITHRYNEWHESIRRAETAHEDEADMMKAMSRAEEYMLKAIKLQQEADELLSGRRLVMQLKRHFEEMRQSRIDTNQNSAKQPLDDIPEELPITNFGQQDDGKLLAIPAPALRDNDRTGSDSLI